MKKSLSPTQWVGLAVSGLMLAVFVMHLLPYWSYQGQSVSIAGYVIRPYEHSTFTELFRSYFGKKYRITLLFGLPMVLSMVGSLLGSVLCVIRCRKWASYLVPVACGLLGIYGLLAGQPYRLSGMWLPMVILHALVLIVGIVGMILAIKTSKKPAIPA